MLPRPRIDIAAALLVVATASAAAGQELVFLAFGDSITQGYGDTSSLGGGYTRRLERWLNQQGHPSVVVSHGVGGETTAQGLSRIDSVLVEGGDYLLLMEGTNDISHHVGIESIRFNLDEMAQRAEDLGMVVVHASVIPRIPTAQTDSSNVRTSALGSSIVNLAAASLRPVADVFTVFEGLPDVFDNYYYYDDEVPDPVGHPNTDGYIALGGVFLETILPLLDDPLIQIDPPEGPWPPGVLLPFVVTTSDSVVRVEWDFGDGGLAIVEPPESFDVFYIFREAGNFTVTARGFTATGAVAFDTVQIAVSGPALDWDSRFALMPAVESSSDGLITSDLNLANDGGGFGLVEVTLLPDIVYDSPPEVRRFLVPPGGELRIPNFIGEALGVGGARGGLVVELLADPDALDLEAGAVVRSFDDLDGSAGCLLPELSQAQWSATAKEISGIDLFSDEAATFHVTNLDSAAGSVRLELYDAGGGFIGAGLFDLAPGVSRQRDLQDLFRDLASRQEPFRARFESSGVRFAAAIVASGHGDEVRCAGATP